MGLIPKINIAETIEWWKELPDNLKPLYKSIIENSKFRCVRILSTKKMREYRNKYTEHIQNAKENLIKINERRKSWSKKKNY